MPKVVPKSMWNTPERIDRANRVIRRLMDGDVQGAMKLLDRVDGRYDMRGFDFALRPGETPFAYYLEDGTIVSKGASDLPDNLFHDIVIENADLSRSLFVFSEWNDCEFHDCTFNHSVFYHTSFRGCSFRRIRFSNCLISHGLGGATEKNLGLFEDVEFVDGEFEPKFSCPRFERCRFKCDMRHIDFNGSQFYDCSFEGKLNDVYFWDKINPLSVQDWMLDRQLPVNPMKNVDFSKAKFKEVIFKGPIDLRECMFPKDVVFVPNIDAVFPEVIRRIEAEWSSPDKEKGIEEATSYMTNKRDYPIGQAVLIPYRKEYLGKEFAQKFISVVREVLGALAVEGKT